MGFVFGPAESMTLPVCFARARLAARSLREGTLLIGLADGVTLGGAVHAGEMVRSGDVVLDDTDQVVQLRRDMERKPALAAA